MADPKKTSALNDFISKFGEKLALAISVLALVAYAVFAFGMSSEDPGIGQVEKNAKIIEKEQDRETKHKDMVSPDIQNWMASAVGPWNTSVTVARPADDWSGSIVTKPEGKAVAKVIVKKKPVVLPPVAFTNVDVAIDSITVAWSYKDFNNAEIQKLGKENTDAAKVTTFVLERDVNGSGKWEVLNDKLDQKTQVYKDTKIEPKAKYQYRLTTYSNDKTYLERGGKIDPETGAMANDKGIGMTVSSPIAQTLGIWKLTFTDPTKPQDAAKGMVYVKIEKYEKNVGKVEKAHIHYDGDRLGWWEETPGAEPVSKHRVSVPPGRSIEVDFNMNATLISVAPVKLPIEVKRCKPIYDKSTGNKTGCDTIIEKRQYDTNLIIYKDEEGEHRNYSPNPGDLNQLCEEHGGKKMIVAPQTPATPAGTDEPKVDPKEAARLKKEADAQKLFEDAQKAEEKNKALAVSYYQKLLDVYKDTEFVAQNKKATIEERLATLKKAK